MTALASSSASASLVEAFDLRPRQRRPRLAEPSTARSARLLAPPYSRPGWTSASPLPAPVPRPPPSASPRARSARPSPAAASRGGRSRGTSSSGRASPASSARPSPSRVTRTWSSSSASAPGPTTAGWRRVRCARPPPWPRARRPGPRTSCSTSRLPHPSEVQAVAEGVLLGSYRYQAYRTSPQPAALGRVAVAVAPDAEGSAATLRAGLAAGLRRAEATNLVRDLVNEPGGMLTAVEFAARAKAEGAANGVKVTVRDEAALRRMGFGGLLAVNRGSVEPPRFVELAYEPRRATPQHADGRAGGQGGDLRLGRPVDQDQRRHGVDEGRHGRRRGGAGRPRRLPRPRRARAGAGLHPPDRQHAGRRRRPVWATSSPTTAGPPPRCSTPMPRAG